MITHIRVKNFKSWLDSGEVKLAPLTGFFGTNSSGKSSLLQMLLLLKQTAEHPDLNQVVFFGDKGSLVNLGNFREVIHGHNTEEQLGLEFGCKLPKLLTVPIIQSINRNIRNYKVIPLDIDSFTFATAFRGNAVNYLYYIVGPEAIQKIKWENGEISYGDIRTDNLEIKNCYGRPAMNQVDSLEPLPSAFEELFSHIYYLGPTRVHPQRHYHWNDKDPTDVGLWGDKVIDTLLCAHMRRMKISKKGEAVTIEDRVSEWLRELDLAYSFSINPVGALKNDNYEVRIQKSATSPPVTLADIGYGLSDVLPMLVLCYYTPKGSTLILEQPGIHLHPKAQAQLADMLIEVITERNLQILVESHSEHLLTRLQRRVAEKQISQDDTALYFCRNDHGFSTIERLEVNEFGEIKNWPENFFGEVMSDMFAMTDAQAKRMKEQDSEN